MKADTIDWTDPKYNDPIEEIYAIRQKISQENDHDIHKIFESVRRKDARAKALGMTYGEYCLAEVEGTLPLCACEEPAGYNAGVSSGGDVAAALAKEIGTTPADLDAGVLRKRLLENGAFV